MSEEELNKILELLGKAMKERLEESQAWDK
jgi:hypothetical protein